MAQSEAERARAYRARKRPTMADVAELDTIVVERSASWRNRAACTGMPHLFYPAGYHDQENREQIARAKAVCAACPVADPCRAEADAEGIWAGTTPRERGHRWGGRSAARESETGEVHSVAPAASPVVEVPWQRDGLALAQALRTVARHGRVALRSRTDPGAGVISRRSGRTLRDHGLIERDRTVDLTGPCWILTPAGRDLAAALQAKHKEPAP